jgi:tRNA-uridine 2-sulfurtransferase
MKQGTKTTKKRVLMALSGGIDSAVSAWKLIQEGYEVEAAFMKNWSSSAGLKYSDCPWLTDRQDALRVAAFLGIPMHTLNFEKQYKKTVMDYFFTEYKNGRTPNPDVMCNKEIKFKLLYDWAMKNGFDYMATGHYAQVKEVIPKNKKTAKGNNHTFQLMRSNDEFKDQTYFIYNIQQSQLPHLYFPIGSMKKSSVKALAKKLKLPNAEKKESMGLCFVGKIRLKDFLEQKLKIKTGPVFTVTGEKIGEHQGLPFYTVGQRQGIRIGHGGPWFVVRKELKDNRLIVTNDPNDKALQTKQIEIHSVNWISKPDKFPAKITGRFRHQGNLEKLTITELGKEHYQVNFMKAQKAIASGQSLVLYDGKVCLGGGIIL